MPRARSSSKNSTANLDFEAKLWLAADKLRSNMDAAEYKHAVFGLIFLKYISDSFEEKHAQPRNRLGLTPKIPTNTNRRTSFGSRLPRAGRICSPPSAKSSMTPMVAIESDNQRLKGVLPKDYARPGLDKHRLGELIDLIGTISFIAPVESAVSAEKSGNKSAEDSGRYNKSKDILGRVYEYFLGQFASAAKSRNQNDEGRKRPQRPHKAVRSTNRPLVWKSSKNHGSSNARQATASLWNIGRRKLPGSHRGRSKPQWSERGRAT